MKQFLKLVADDLANVDTVAIDITNIVDVADKHDTPVIDNIDVTTTIDAMIEHIIDEKQKEKAQQNQ